MAAPTKIKIRETDSEIKSSESSCKICLQNEAKYTCPRCNLAYCSVPCYQGEKHSGCSESFYKDCVITELQDMSSSEADKKKVMEMLSRQMEEAAEDEGVPPDDDDEEHQSLADRLEGLDLDKDVSAVWGLLSPKEKEEFARMLQDGRLARLIELWTPWWKCPINLSLVRENKKMKDKKDVGNGGADIPAVVKDIPDINTLLKNGRPSSDCRFDLVNILFAYAFVARVHNGDHLETPVDSSQLVVEISAVLGGQAHCGSVGEAVQLSLDALDQYNSKEDQANVTAGFNLTLLEDVSWLVTGPGGRRMGGGVGAASGLASSTTNSCSLTFMEAALSDLVRLLQTSVSIVKKELKANKQKDENLAFVKSSLFKAERKAMFFLSWLQRFGMGMGQLMPLLQLEIERRQSDLEEVGELKECVEENFDKLRAKASCSSSDDTDKLRRSKASPDNATASTSDSDHIPKPNTKKKIEELS